MNAMMPRLSLSPDQVAEAVLAACKLDIEAFKPGNVSLASAGHGMQAGHFLKSADAITAAMSTPDLQVGERILRSIEATYQAVRCNTNLGIVLLCVPLAQAALCARAETRLEGRVQAVLQALTVQDAAAAFQAICLAAPAGLGASHAHDVHDIPAVSLLTAMQAAQSRDRIAYQYANDFADIFKTGVPYIRTAMGRGRSEKWAAAGVYLEFLSRFPDSHIQRKWGPETAMKICRDAWYLNKEFSNCQKPATLFPKLKAFDRALKSAGINPGTCADMTVASLLAVRLENLLGALPQAKPVARQAAVPIGSL